MNKLRSLTVTILITALIAMTPLANVCFAETADAADAAISAQDAVITAEFPEVRCESETPLDNDELFEGYINSLLWQKSPQKLLAKRRTPLTGINLAIYEKLKPEIVKIANGTRTSTVIEIPVEDLNLEKNGWTAAELGVDAIVENGRVTEEAKTAFQKMLNIDFSAIMSTLLAECPFEMYWYDKQEGVGISGCGMMTNGKILMLAGEFEISFSVAQDYAAGQYELDTTKIDRVHHAVDKAAAIVEANKGKTDREKLRAYKDAICGLVAYDYEAAGSGDAAYGDPWQLVSVFDELDGTNVVCEGYAKAFQYLCDLTEFYSDISCITVTGIMSGGTGAGGHMWNVVRLENGKNYIADVTNCDTGSVGEPDQLFLAGYTSGNISNGYMFRCSGGNIRYLYDEETINDYDESELTIAERVTEPGGHTEEVIPGKAATCTEEGLTEGKRCSVCGEILVEQKVIPATGHTEEAIPSKAATCTEDGLTEGRKCSVCGESLVAQEVIPALGHTEEAMPGKAATCTEDGLTEGAKCSVCGDVLVEQEVIPAFGHTEEAMPGKTATCTEDGITEGAKCSVCGETLVAQEVIPALGHNWGEWETVTEPTEEAAGLEKRTCSRCGEEDSRVIPELGHVHDPQHVAAKAAACTEDGNIECWTCSKCGRFFTDENAENEIDEESTVIKAAGHTDEVMPGKAATCTEDGLTEGRKCSVCGESLVAQEVIPALGHDYLAIDGTAVAAGCLTDGKEANQKCSRCDSVITGETIPALGHDYLAVDGTAVAAGCLTDGKEANQKCSRCDSVITGETILATGHVEEVMPRVEPTYTKTGLTEGKKCSVCGEILVPQEVIPMLERTSIASAAVSGLKAKVYTGKAQTQALTIKLGAKTLKSGTDYKLSYSKNTNVGTATVTITGINAYKGTIQKTFRINPKPTTMISVSAVSKGFTAKWRKQATQTTGYQIQYSTSSTFKSGNKTVTITKNTTLSRKITKLKAKKRYYVRVRTYRRVGGTNYYSAWSAKKAITTRK